MKEYEYEVKFYGEHWVTNIIIYHELEDNTPKNHQTLVNWAETVADHNGLTMSNYCDVILTKTGELV